MSSLGVVLSWMWCGAMKGVFAALLVLSTLSISCEAAFNVSTAFYAHGRRLNITVGESDGEVFTIRGFSYSNARIGEGAPTNEGYDSLSRPEICEEDFALMRQVHANSIKLYAFNPSAEQRDNHSACLDLAWNEGTQPVFVVASVWITSLPFASSAEQDAMVQMYRAMVQQTCMHPAIMGYSIGSEIAGDPASQEYWNSFNDVAMAVREELAKCDGGAARKIITTGTYQTNNVDPEVCCIAHVIQGEKYGAEVDAWGVDVYSPDPGELFLRENIFEYTTKPFWFPEYGVSFQPENGSPAELSRVLAKQAAEVEEFSYQENGPDGNNGGVFDPEAPLYAGGMIFEWIDEYWKAPLDGSNCEPTPSSAQPFYGSNAVQLLSGCPCVEPSARSADCQLDQRLPRPILEDAALLPAIWKTYTPSSLA